jgi:hypothetical protein
MKEDICPVCGGVKTESTTSFTVDYNSGVDVIMCMKDVYLK